MWAGRNGVAGVTVYRWFRAGLLRVLARRVGWLILVDDPVGEIAARGWTAVDAWVLSADQESELDRQVVWVSAWATTRQVPVDRVVTDVGSALDGHRRTFFALLRDRAVMWIVVEHRGRFCWFGSAYVRAVLAAQGRELLVVDAGGVGGDLVCDITEILTSMWARWYGTRAAVNRAQRGVAAVADGEAA